MINMPNIGTSEAISINAEGKSAAQISAYDDTDQWSKFQYVKGMNTAGESKGKNHVHL